MFCCRHRDPCGNFYRDSCCGGPYYPYPIFTCCCGWNYNSGNISPIYPPSVTGAATAAVTAGSYAAGEAIPLTISSVTGSAISAGLAGSLELAQGTYQVTINGTATVPASGTASLALRVNGNVVPSTITSVTGAAGSTATLNNTFLISVPNGSSVELVNNGTDSVSITGGNITLVKVS